jgi:two-component system phosphate regulon sensor histidine kinase PhoR
MKPSIFAKILIGYAVIASVFVALFLVFSTRTIRGHHIDARTSDLTRLATTLGHLVTPDLESDASRSLDLLIKRLGQDVDMRITVMDTAGAVLADSWEDPARMGSHRTRPEVMMAFRGGVGTSERYSETISRDMLYVAVPLRQEQRIIGIIRVSSLVSDIDSWVKTVRNGMIGAILTIVVLTVVVSLVVARNITGPVKKLGEASRKVASGDLDVRVLIESSDEIKDLADNFNMMIDRVKNLLGDLSERQEELSSIVSSIQDGLLVLDKDGRILLTNDSFERITGQKATEGRFYWEVVQSAQLSNLVQEVMDIRSGLVREAVLIDRVYLCSAAFLEAQGGVVVLIHDITDLRRVEKLKKDFVVNLSHELRTPLTAMKGFLETLEGEVSDDGRYYLDIVRRHTDRLADIVSDLLMLSELEHSGARLELEEVDLHGMINDILKIFEPRLKGKHLDLAVNTADENLVVRGDYFKLEQVFVNLIANAVKYTETGGITISLRLKDSSVVVKVSDTGIGISDEHLPRIFERFYVVDKSRSKRVGGTGLGLSIVKHIVLLHNGHIEVASELGAGTSFTVTLPSRPS